MWHKNHGVHLALPLCAGVSLGQDAVAPVPPVPDAHFPFGDAVLADVIQPSDATTNLTAELGTAASLNAKDRFHDAFGAVPLKQSATSFIRVPLEKIQGLAAFTASMWINPDADALADFMCLLSMSNVEAHLMYVCLKGNAAGGGGLPGDEYGSWFPTDGSGVIGQGAGLGAPTKSVPRNEWSHMSISRTELGVMSLKRHVKTASGGETQLLVEWVTDAAVTIPAELPSGLIFGNEIQSLIGTEVVCNPGSAFVGKMDDIRIFTRAVTDEEMMLLADPATPPPTLAPTPTIAPEGAGAGEGDDGSDKSSGWGVLAAVLASILGCLLCLGLIAFVLTRRAKGQQPSRDIIAESHGGVDANGNPIATTEAVLPHAEMMAVPDAGMGGQWVATQAAPLDPTPAATTMFDLGDLDDL